MAETNAENWLKIAMKYGVGGLIALYLTYFMASTMDEKLDKIIETEETSVEILKDIRYYMQAQTRGESVRASIPPPIPRP